MTFEQMLKILTHGVATNRRGFKWLKFAKDHQDKIISARYLNHKADPLWGGSPDIVKQSAYDACVSVELRVKDGFIQLTLTCYEGDNLYGLPKNPEAEYILKLTEPYEIIEEVCTSTLRDIAVAQVEQEDAEIRKQRIDAKVATFLADV